MEPYTQRQALSFAGWFLYPIIGGTLLGSASLISDGLYNFYLSQVGWFIWALLLGPVGMFCFYFIVGALVGLIVKICFTLVRPK
jgi:TM2 domain-containing membrane protein YozV